MSELLIRPGYTDNAVVADLLAPGGGGAVLLPHTHRPVSRLVLDAPVAAARPQFSEIAADAGTPVVVDPLTPLLQGEVAEDNSWAGLPFGLTEVVSRNDLASAAFQDWLVGEVIPFEVQAGATVIVPPYLYGQSPDDPAFTASVEMIGRTARFLRENHVGLPLMPVLCVQHRAFSQKQAWRHGLDRFAHAAVDVGPQAIGMCLSPVGDGTERYAKLLQLFASAHRLKATGATVFAWRQGLYGPALVAAGLDGYECGIGVRERSDLSALMQGRKPRKPGESRALAPAGVFMQTLGRSVSKQIAEVLLDDRGMRARVVCTDPRCCPHGADSMLTDARAHAVRARSRYLRDLDEMPHQDWRLHQTSKDAYSAALTAARANGLLTAAGIKTRIPTAGYESLADVAEYVSRNELAA